LQKEKVHQSTRQRTLTTPTSGNANYNPNEWTLPPPNYDDLEFSKNHGNMMELHSIENNQRPSVFIAESSFKKEANKPPAASQLNDYV
jgi:hypothetical protein